MPKKLRTVKSIKRRKKNIFLRIIELNPGKDTMISVVTFLLMIFGTLMILSVNVGRVTSYSNAVVRTAIKQVAVMAVSYGCMWAANRAFNLQKFSKSQILYVLGLAGINMIPFMFAAEKGAQSWIRLPGGFTIQPSEFVKPLMIAVCAAAIFNAIQNKKRGQSFLEVIKMPAIALVIFAVEIGAQRDLGTLAIIILISFVCFLVADLPALKKAQQISTVIFFSLVIFAFAFLVSGDFLSELFENTVISHVSTRINNAKNPYADPYGEGYQPANALYGIADSKFFGKGFGSSTRKFGYLTQAENDYIFAVLIEETGIFGLGALLLLYGILMYRLFYYAFKTKRLPYKVVLTGNAAYIFIHFFFNVGGVGAFIPMTGIPLLFISEGGSSLFAICTAIGMSQSCISDIRKNELKR